MFPTAGAEDNSQVTSLDSYISPLRNASDSVEITQVAKQNNSNLTLNMLVKEIIFCLALALTTYGALHNTSSKVSKHPQAVRFFSHQSKVNDWYRGQLSLALSLINAADVAFVMYYAPWDAESQHVRQEFDKAAFVLSDRVHFSAINCWNPGSECRLLHNKIPSWPILMVYTVNSKGVMFKGPKNAHSMVKFLQLIMKPLERVSSTADIVNLLSICDAVAVGYTPLTESSKYYNVWYHTALTIREYDPFGELCFATVTSDSLAIDFGVDSVPSARLMMWNDTKEYKVNGDLNSWNQLSLLHWILRNFSLPVSRIVPMWKKAYTFESFVDGSPILILFTPLNPMFEQLPSYALLREVAIEYNNCNNNETTQWTTELGKLQQVQRLLYEQRDLMKFCKNYKYKKPISKQSRYFKKYVISHNNKYPWSNATDKTQKKSFSNFLNKPSLALTGVVQDAKGSDVLSSLNLLEECSNVLPAEKSFYDHYEKCHSYEKENVDAEQEAPYIVSEETSMLPHVDDKLSAENLIQEQVKYFCKLIKFANEWGPVIKPGRAENISDVNGLACARNFSLNMVAIDSVLNHHFAESLGIDVLNKKDMTAVVILDSKHEIQYVLKQDYSAKSVRDFIRNFTHTRLKRTLRTRVDDAAHTHYFGSDGITEQMEVNDSTIHIVDLTTRTFKRFIMAPGMVSIVAVCGGGCPAHTSRSVTQATRLLASCGVRVRSARLDALRHDLTWQYTVSTYPTLLVFVAPARGGEPESRCYPPTARVTASGLVAVVLRALGTPHDLRVRLSLCVRSMSNFERKTCLRDLKGHVSTVIGRNLKYWRSTEDKQLKDAFLKRLQYLHRVSLDISLLNEEDLKDITTKHSSLLKSLSELSLKWDIHEILRRSKKATKR